LSAVSVNYHLIKEKYFEKQNIFRHTLHCFSGAVGIRRIAVIQHGILGKILYYSVSNILIDRGEFQRIGSDFGLAKTKPARESAADAFSKATTALYERVTVKNGSTPTIFRVYCRNNKRTAKDSVSRELVKEEPCESTNSYTKLMNIEFDK